MNKTEQALAAKVAQALHSSQSAVALRVGAEYMIDAIQNDLVERGDEEDTPETFWDHCLENLEVEVMDELIKLIPDAEWNEDENQHLLMSFMDVIRGEKDKILGEVEDQASDSRAYARDPYAYNGVSRNDF